VGAEFGPCGNWPVTWTCDLDTLNPAVTGTAVSLATSLLWSLTGQRFGLCRVTLRPCARDCDSGRFYDDAGPPWAGSRYPAPALVGGQWVNLVCGSSSCAGSCSCTRISEVLLPAPVHQVIEVTVDGAPLAAGAWRLDNARILVRTDGGQWPRCNDLNLPDSEPGTWSVTADYGEPVPAGADVAVGALACEVAKAANGEDCSLPPGIQQLVRQGVTISYPDMGALLKDGRTGVYLADVFVATWNPNGLKRRARVFSVDRRTPRRPGT